MTTRLVKYLKRTLLFLGVAIAIAVAPHSYANPQLEPQQNGILAPIAQAQILPTQSTVQVVASVGMTVSDMEQMLEFYTRVLPFRKISDVEVWGSEYEQLEGVFGARMRVVRLQLGNEVIELTDYLTPEGRPIPIDSRSNDHWFQHMAIVVRDMDQAYQYLRQHNIQHISTAPSNACQTT